jgi:hypothetical protein
MVMRNVWYVDIPTVNEDDEGKPTWENVYVAYSRYEAERFLWDKWGIRPSYTHTFIVPGEIDMRVMRSYHVHWGIYVDAHSPEEAAREALRIQRDRDSIATVFSVMREDENSEITVDLSK